MSAPERTEAEMAERIAAFEAAPAAPESWTGSQVAVDLRMAADVLERDGWTKGSFHATVNGRVCHCTSGAIAVATGAHFDVQPAEVDGEKYTRQEGEGENIERWNQARTWLADFLHEPVAYWNDQLIGRPAQAIAALRAAADEADQL